MLSKKAFHIVYVILLPLTVYFCIFAEPWIILVGGVDYLEAAWTMRILLLAVLPIGLSNIVGGQMLIPMGHEKELFLAEAVAALINVFLNAVLIPNFSASGAAVATVVSEIIVLIIAAYCLLKQISTQIIIPKYLICSLIGCIIAGTGSFGVSLLLPDNLNGLISIVVFGFLYGLTMLMLQDSLYQEMLSVVKKIRTGLIGRNV